MAALATKLSLSLCSTMSAVAVSSKVKGKSKANYYGRSMSALEARVSLLFALASQSQRVVTDLVAKSVAPMSRNLEEALMAVPDLETVNFKVLSRKDEYDIRQVEPYFIAETTMPGREGFDFFGASQSFNLLAEYLFGKNMPNEKIEMTTPVITRRTTNGDKMEMTTPVITRKAGNQEKWKMSFVMPSKYGSNLPVPKDSAVRITKVPKKIVAVAAFSGFVTEEDVKQRESKLRKALKNNLDFKVKVGAEVEIAQYNPPFALPFTRRNEIALEVERRKMND